MTGPGAPGPLVLPRLASPVGFVAGVGDRVVGEHGRLQGRVGSMQAQSARSPVTGRFPDEPIGV